MTWRLRLREVLIKGLLSGIVVAAGLVALLVITLLVFGLPLIDSLKLIVQGAFGDKFGWARTFVKMCPLLLTALGMVVAWRSGAYNIGGEGQFVIGGVAGAAFAKFVLHTGVGGTIGILISCALGGAIWAWLAGWLYVRRRVEVVISTILLNFVALQILSYAVSGPLQEAKKQVPLSDLLPDSVMLWRPDRQTDLHIGVLLALVLAGVVWVFLFRTRPGFILRFSGENPRAARANGFDADRSRLLAMAISGSLCGLAAGIEYLGPTGQLSTGFSQQWGFLGIPVALLGGLHPLLCLGSAFYFAALFAGSENLARFTPAGTTLIYVIQAMAVIGFVALRAIPERKTPAPEAS